MYIRARTIIAFPSGKEEPPSQGKCKFSAWKVKPSFHIVVGGLLRSLLLEFKISSKTVNDHMETRMKFLQRQVTTLKDSQRLGRWDTLDSKSTSATVNNLERLPTTLSFYLWYMETNEIPLATANDPERPPTTGSD